MVVYFEDDTIFYTIHFKLLNYLIRIKSYITNSKLGKLWALPKTRKRKAEKRKKSGKSAEKLKKVIKLFKNDLRDEK